MTKKALVAVVDDDDSMRETTKDLLESAGLAAATFASAEALLQSGRLAGIACVVSDLRMPGMSGLALHAQLVASGKPLPTILMTAYPDERVRTRALEAGVVACLTKPFADDELLGCINAALAAA
jgi:FixJ family two-component response regulator